LRSHDARGADQFHFRLKEGPQMSDAKKPGAGAPKPMTPQTGQGNPAKQAEKSAPKPPSGAKK
jgi:hypothetical protein